LVDCNVKNVKAKDKSGGFLHVNMGRQITLNNTRIVRSRSVEG